MFKQGFFFALKLGSILPMINRNIMKSVHLGIKIEKRPKCK